MSDNAWTRQVRELALTLLFAAAGGLVFFAVGLPAPWLSGPAASVGAAGIAGVSLQVPNWLRQATFIFLGSTMGSAVTPATLSLMMKWPISLLGLALSLVGIMFASSAYLVSVHGYDRMTARLAAVPGALPYVL